MMNLVRLFCVIGISLFQPVFSKHVKCLPNASGNLGATFPRNDIYLKKGDPLELYCRLNLEEKHVKGLNASNIEFRFSRTNVTLDKSDITVLNETTALLTKSDLPVDNHHVMCFLNPELRDVCSNEVYVGYEPLNVTNFDCLGHNLESLNCTWKIPANPIKTKYTIYWKYREYEFGCPTYDKSSCFWGRHTEPHYRQFAEKLKFKIIANNTLGTKIFHFNLDHQSLVVPSAPELNVTVLGPYNIGVQWFFDRFEDFEPGLVHNVTICALEVPYCFHKTEKTHRHETDKSLNVEVPYAFTAYKVMVSMKSGTAEDDPRFWSTVASQNVLTLVTVPKFPPNTTQGAFQATVLGGGERKVYVHWTKVPFYLKNGANFSYLISYEEDGELITNVTSECFAEFIVDSGKSYSFKIQSMNENGITNEASVIDVPANAELPAKIPKTINVTDYDNGTFEISWSSNELSENGSYTVFLCHSPVPRTHQCRGGIKWKTVPVERFNVLIHDEEGSLNAYGIALAVNEGSWSSGMLWGSCFMNPGKGVHQCQKTATGGFEWPVWLVFSIAALCILTVSAFMSVKLYHCLKEMQEFDVKLPPGLSTELNGVSYKMNGKRIRKNAEADSSSLDDESTARQMRFNNSGSINSDDFLNMNEVKTANEEHCLIDKIKMEICKVPEEGEDETLFSLSSAGPDDISRFVHGDGVPSSDVKGCSMADDIILSPSTMGSGCVIEPLANPSTSQDKFSYPVEKPEMSNSFSVNLMNHDNAAPNQSSNTSSYVSWNQLPNDKAYCKVGIAPRS